MEHIFRMEELVERQNITLTSKEAEEYCAYKRQKKLEEIMAALRRSESVWTGAEGVEKVCERAARLRQSAVRMPLIDLHRYRERFQKSGVKTDCLVGGNGETATEVKAYEAKRALKAGAKEITLVLAHSLICNNRYVELKKEVKKIRKKLGKAVLKVRVEKKYPYATVCRLARMCSEAGAQYFSLPYFPDCLRVETELSGGCLLEISDVETLEQFKQTAGVGMRRVVTTRAWEVYAEWLKEVENVTVERRQLTFAPHSLEKEKGNEQQATAAGKPTEKENNSVEKGGGQTEKALALSRFYSPVKTEEKSS